MKKVFLCLSLIVFLLITTELLLRILWHPAVLDPRYKRNDLGWAMENVVLNKYGYRDRDFDLAKKINNYRIYFLGDSFSYGWYINDINDSLPKILEKSVKDKFKEKQVEVINASRPGFSFAEKLDRFQNDTLKFTPDIVVSEVTLGDFVEKEYPPKFTKNKFIKDLKLYQFFVANPERSRVARLNDDEIIKTYQEGSPRLQIINDSFKIFSNLAKSINAKPVILLFPEYDLENPNQKYKYESYHEQIKEIADQYEITVVDLLIPFNKVEDKKTLILNPTDAHPSVTANKIGAQFLLDSISIDNIFSKPPNTFNVNKKRIEVGNTLPVPTIILETSKDWVYFDEVNKSGVQSLILPDPDEREVKYYEDKLKTTRSFTDSGWVGGRVEHYIKAGKEIEIKDSLYGYKIVGINQVKGYYRLDGGLNSQDLRPEELEITKNNGKITISVKSDINYELFKISFDLSTKQFDLDNGVVKNFSQTYEMKKTLDEDSNNVVIPLSSKLSSLPKFLYDEKSTSYCWVDNEMIFVKSKSDNQNITIDFKSKINKGSIITMPISQEMIGNFERPIVSFLQI